MKRPSVFLMFLLMVFTISGVKCNVDFSKLENTKVKLNEQCYDDEDCFSGNCRRSIFIFLKYCKEPISMSSPIKVFQQIIMPRVNDGICIYTKSTNGTNSTTTDEPSELFVSGINLPLNSKVEVTYGSKTELVTINKRIPSSITERSVILSNEVAQRLGIENSEESPCKIHLPVYKNCILLRCFVKISPFIGVLLGVFMLNQYFNF